MTAAASISAESGDARKPVFIVGAPRSGTTWLQRLMAAHPLVASTQETELVSHYLAGCYDTWRRQLPDDPDEWQRHRHRGLPAVLTQTEFDGCVGDLARSVYAKTLRLKPTARVVVDKNPDYSRHVDLIRHLFPGAGVVHIVRDGRDVVESMLAASRGWGRDWAPRRLGLAARTWRLNVEAAGAAATSGRYLEVRYEDLLAAGAQTLGECLAFAGVPSSAAECRGILDALSGAAATDSLVWSGEVVRRLGSPPGEPAGFVGAGGSGRWRTAWTARDRLEFDLEAGDLLRRLGYAADSSWVGVAPPRRAAAVRVARAKAATNRLGWKLHTALGRRGIYVHVARIAPYE